MDLRPIICFHAVIGKVLETGADQKQDFMQIRNKTSEIRVNIITITHAALNLDTNVQPTLLIHWIVRRMIAKADSSHTHVVYT